MKEDSVNHEKTINVQKQDLWLGMAVVPSEGISDVVWSSPTGRLAWGRISSSPSGVSEPEEREDLSKELL